MDLVDLPLDDLTLLKCLLKKAVTVESVALFEQFLADQLPEEKTPPPTPL